MREGLVLCCRPVAASVDTAVAGALAVAGTPVACTADNVALAAVESTLLVVAYYWDTVAGRTGQTGQLSAG